MSSTPTATAGPVADSPNRTLHAWWQAAPFTLVFALFFLVPLALVITVSFWDFNEYELLPAFTLRNYAAIFEGCSSLTEHGDFCVSLSTYLSTLKFSLLVWLITLVLGFAVAYFLAFHVRSPGMQTLLFVLCTVPFWTSNIIRMISWIPLLGKEGLINQALLALGVIRQPLEVLLFSDLAVVIAYVHQLTIFMIVPIFNSMARIDKKLIEAAIDAGASRFDIMRLIVVPMSRSGIALGTIFVVSIVMGDFFVVKVMSGGGSASVVSAFYEDVGVLQYPTAAASAVLLTLVLVAIVSLILRTVDIRQEITR